MPNKAAAKKWLRQSAKRALLNKARREAVKNTVKKTLASATKQTALEAVRLAQQALDKAAKRGVIKKNTAARKLSRLMSKVHAMAK